MKAKLLYCCIFISVILTSCKLKDTADFGTDTGNINTSGGSVTFKGSVYDSQSGLPIKQAVIRLVVDGVNKGSTTDSLGLFNFTTTIAASGEYPFITSKEGYYPDTLSTFALIDQTIEIPTVRLFRQSTTIDPSGNAASIVLKSKSTENIGIKGSGSQEAGNIVFEVQDANGKPVDPDHAVILNFRIGASPGAQEYLFPLSVKTNSYGLATVTLNSGTKAGVVQVIAETTVNGTLIKSMPVAMLISGGLPDPNHFIVTSDKLNYPYLGIAGQVIQFSAFLRDKFSNPVRPGTSVYFEATDGIMETMTAQTDDKGVATVSLITQTTPDHPVLGPGYFEVKASTIDETSTIITTSTSRLLTGSPTTLTISPTTFNIANGSSQSFTFTLTDILGHPMAPGTSVSVTTEGGSTKLYGAVAFTIDDSMVAGNGSTIFSFLVADGDAKKDEATSLTIKISVTSSRGSISTYIMGTVN